MIKAGGNGPLFGLPRTLVRYLAVGVLNTCVGLSSIYFLLYVLHLDDLPANFIGYCIGILFSFAMNKFWTFSNRQSGAVQFVKFLVVTGAAYCINIAIVEIFINVVRANHYVAQACGVVPYTIVGYLGSRYFAFRPPAAAAVAAGPGPGSDIANRR